MVKSTSRNAKTKLDKTKLPSRPANTIVLVGFMGAGKTSVGRALAARLGWPFEDLDDRIQAREKRSIERIFQESGEAAFRRAESASLRDLLRELGASPRVIALGGGAIVQRDNAEMLKEAKVHTVFLDGSVEELRRRCEKENRVRPLQRDVDHFRQLYQQRRPSYLSASLRIDATGKDIETVAAEVACSLGLE